MFHIHRLAGALCATVAIAGLMNVTEAKTPSKFTEQQQVIGSYKYGKYSHNVVSIPKWQNDIMNRLRIPFQTQLVLRTINTAECGDENGFCISYNKQGGTVDCGFYQINQIHAKEHKWCVEKVKEGKEEVEKAKKSKDWKKVVKIRNELYETQARWTWERMKSQVSRFKLPEDRESRIYKLAKLHNGGKHKEDYAKKALVSYRILSKYYSSK